MFDKLTSEFYIITITGVLCILFCLWVIIQYTRKILLSERLSKIMLFGLVSTPALMVILPITFFLQEKMKQNGFDGNLYIGAFGIVAFSYVLIAGLTIRIVGKKLP